LVPLTHLVTAACSAVKERAYELAGQKSVGVNRPFILSTYSLLVFKQFFLRCLYVNHLDVYQQRMFYFYSGCLAENRDQDYAFYFELA